MPNTAKHNDEEIASHADYASMDFKAYFTKEEAEKIGSEILNDECVRIRIAVAVLSKDKDELLNGFGEDKETLMETIEQLQSQERFFDEIKAINERAIARLLSVAASIIDEK